MGDRLSMELNRHCNKLDLLNSNTAALTQTIQTENSVKQETLTALQRIADQVTAAASAYPRSEPARREHHPEFGPEGRFGYGSAYGPYRR